MNEGKTNEVILQTLNILKTAWIIYDNIWLKGKDVMTKMPPEKIEKNRIGDQGHRKETIAHIQTKLATKREKTKNEQEKKETPTTQPEKSWYYSYNKGHRTVKIEFIYLSDRAAAIQFIYMILCAKAPSTETTTIKSHQTKKKKNRRRQ